MKELLMTCLVALGMCAQSNAQHYNSVFPIVNAGSKMDAEFIAASIFSVHEYLGMPIYKVSSISQYEGSKPYNYRYAPDGYDFISFKYVTKTSGYTAGQWNSGSETRQILFHPGGEGYRYEYEITKKVYGFIFSEKDGLALCDLFSGSGMNIVAKLHDGTDILNYASLTVFAGTDYNMKDIIVVAGKNTFKVFETIPETSSVRSVYVSDEKPTYFDMNGIRHDTPQKGVNIVVDGETAKKIAVK